MFRLSSIVGASLRSSVWTKGNITQSLLRRSFASFQVADPFFVDLLFNYSKWTFNDDQMCRKFEFRDEKTTDLFVARGMPILTRYCSILFLHFVQRVAKDSLSRLEFSNCVWKRENATNVSVRFETMMEESRPVNDGTPIISALEAHAASSLDSVAAEIQLQGRWN